MAFLAAWILVVVFVPSVALAGFVEGRDAYATGDYATAYAEFREAANRGHAASQYHLGMMHRLGQGVSQNAVLAALWYWKAGEQGHAKAQYWLGVMHRRGLGMKKNDVKAVRWYRKAAEQGHILAELWLGIMYGRGRGVEQDYAEAAKWYRRAADQGNAVAQHNLGWLYRDGAGVPENKVEAHKWFSLFVAQEPDSQHAWVLGELEEYMTAMEIVEAKERARNWRPSSGK